MQQYAVSGVLPISQRFSEYAPKERDDYPTQTWVTETIVAHLKALNIASIWEPAAGEGGMAAALTGAGFAVTATDLSDGINFLDDTWSQVCLVLRRDRYQPSGQAGRAVHRTGARSNAAQSGRGCNASQGGLRFRSDPPQVFRRLSGVVTKLVLLKRIEWFKSLNGNTPSDNHAWYLWSWRDDGRPALPMGHSCGNAPSSRVSKRTALHPHSKLDGHSPCRSLPT